MQIIFRANWFSESFWSKSDKILPRKIFLSLQNVTLLSWARKIIKDQTFESSVFSLTTFKVNEIDFLSAPRILLRPHCDEKNCATGMFLKKKKMKKSFVIGPIIPLAISLYWRQKHL